MSAMINNNSTGIEGPRYSDDEVKVLRSIFDACDPEKTGKIHINQLPGFLSRVGKSEDEIISITEASTKVADENEGQIRFDALVTILEQLELGGETLEGPDPKVYEFLRILEEYRIKCEEEGNYLEAGRAHKQLSVLRKQEEKRQQKSIQARQISERQDVQLAHNMQFSEFNGAWDKYMEEYDSMAQMYIQQMTERHALVLLEFQKSLRNDMAAKPPRWSKELMEQRRKQHVSARNKQYAEAQKLKKVCDRTEEKEKKEMEQDQSVIFARREAKYRLQQQAELQALLKRIECRRKEHIKQRNLDSKRLLQRNRNVQSVLESKQAAETQKLYNDIKKSLLSNVMPMLLTNNNNNNAAAGSAVNVAKKNKANNSSNSSSSSSNNNAYNQYNIDSNEGEDEYINDNNASFLTENGPNFSSLVYDDN